MQTIEQPAFRIADARAPLWFGSGPTTWGDGVQAGAPAPTPSAAGGAPGRPAVRSYRRITDLIFWWSGATARISRQMLSARWGSFKSR